MKRYRNYAVSVVDVETKTTKYTRKLQRKQMNTPIKLVPNAGRIRWLLTPQLGGYNAMYIVTTASFIVPTADNLITDAVKQGGLW